MKKNSIFKALCFSCFCVSVAYPSRIHAQPIAQSSEPAVVYKTREDIPEVICEILQRHNILSGNIERYVLAFFRERAQDKKVLRQSDIERLRLQAEVSRRKAAAKKLLDYDDNFDGIVTRQELENAMMKMFGITEADHEAKSRVKSDIRMFIETQLRADVNGDGKIDLTEAAEFSSYRTEDNVYAERFLSLDLDGDGAFSIQEMTAILKAGVAVLDQNKDGRIDTQETQWLYKKNNERKNKNQDRSTLLARCQFPVLKRGETLVFVVTDEGGYYSSAGLGGQADVTYAADINIAPGDGTRRYYVVAASAEKMVWRLRGDVKHISQVVVVGPKSNSGVVGVSAGQVVFAKTEDCFFEVQKEIAEHAASGVLTKNVKFLTGHAPVMEVVAPQLLQATFDTLTGSVEKKNGTASNLASNQNTARDMKSLLEQAVRPVADLKVNEIVSQNQRIDLYAVPPGVYGLEVLIKNGAIELMPNGSRPNSFFFKVKSTVPALPIGLGEVPGVTFSFSVPTGVAASITMPKELYLCEPAAEHAQERIYSTDCAAD